MESTHLLRCQSVSALTFDAGEIDPEPHAPLPHAPRAPPAARYLPAEGLLSALRAMPSRPVSSKDRRDDGSEMLVSSRIKSAQKLQRHKTYPCPTPPEARYLPALSENLLLALRTLLPSRPV